MTRTYFGIAAIAALLTTATGPTAGAAQSGTVPGTPALAYEAVGNAPPSWCSTAAPG